MLFLTVMLMLCALVLVQGELNVYSNEKWVVRAGTVHGDWDPQYSEAFACHPVRQQVERSWIDTREFLFVNTGQDTIEISGISVVSQDEAVAVPSIDKTSFLLGPNVNSTLNLEYNCAEEHEDNAWSRIELYFDCNKTMYRISYTKICSFSGGGLIDLPHVFLLILAVATVGLSAYSVRILRGGALLSASASQITSLHAFSFILFGSSFLVLTFLFIEYLSIILAVFTAIGGTVGI